MWCWCLCSALWWGVLWVCERPNLVVLLLALSGLGSGLFGTRKAPSLSVLQMLSYFVRDAGVVEVFVIRAWEGWLCSPMAASRRAAVCSGSDSSVPVAGSCGQWSCTTCGHGYFTAEAAELSFQLPASLFSSCEGESIAAGLFWHHNPVDPFPQACPHCGLEPAAALSNVMLVIKPKCYKATSLLSEN